MEALGHLSVGLEERFRRDPKAKSRQLLVELAVTGQEARVAAVGDLRALGRTAPEDARVGEAVPDEFGEGLVGETAIARHQTHLKHPGAATLAYDEVPQEAAAGAPVVSAEALRAAPLADLIPHRVAALGRKHAVPHALHRVPPTSGVKSKHEPTSRPKPVRRLAAGRQFFRRPERILHLVPVAPGLFGRHDRLEREVVETPEATQRVVEQLVLAGELGVVAHRLPGGAGAAAALVFAAHGDAVGARLEQLHRSRVREIALRLDHLRPDDVSWVAALDEDDESVVAGDPRTAMGDAFDPELQHVAAPGLRRFGFRGTGHDSYPAMPLNLDLDTYSAEAERFVGAMDREYYLHFAGHKQALEIETIYERHRSLFERQAVDELREELDRTGPGDERRRVRYLLELAAGGLMGAATKAEETALAEREATLEIEIDGRREAYRQSSVIQANEPDPDRRAEIERARLELLEAELNPLHVAMTERVHGLARELGWASYRAMCQELKGIDLGDLAGQTSAFSGATAPEYRERVEPALRKQTGRGFDAL